MDVLMPQLGETVAEGKISRWFVSAGDAVKPGDNLFEIETDKVSMEVPAISAGVLSAINVAAGETAPVGAVVATILGVGESAPTSPLTPAPGSDLRSARGQASAGLQDRAKKEPDSRLRGNERQETPKPAIPMEPFREVRSPERNYGPARLPGGTVVTPLARRLAGDAGIDLANVKGSGPHGRIVAADIETARRTSSPAQTRAIAPVVLTADIEIGRSLDLAGQAKLSLSDVIIKAWATALKRRMPSEHSDIALVSGKTRAVIRDAAGKSLTAIATARNDPGAASDTQGASSAVFIVDVPGIASVIEALRPPQTTMLSIGSQRRAPVEAADGSVKFADIMTVTLACDAHVVDGTLGAGLLAAFKGLVEQPVTMIV